MRKEPIFERGDDDGDNLTVRPVPLISAPVLSFRAVQGGEVAAAFLDRLAAERLRDAIDAWLIDTASTKPVPEPESTEPGETASVALIEAVMRVGDEIRAMHRTLEEGFNKALGRLEHSAGAVLEIETESVDVARCNDQAMDGRRCVFPTAHRGPCSFSVEYELLTFCTCVRHTHDSTGSVGSTCQTTGCFCRSSRKRALGEAGPTHEECKHCGNAYLKTRIREHAWREHGERSW